MDRRRLQSRTIIYKRRNWKRHETLRVASREKEKRKANDRNPRAPLTSRNHLAYKNFVTNPVPNGSLPRWDSHEKQKKISQQHMVSAPSSLGVSCCLLSCYLGLVALVLFLPFFVFLLFFPLQEDPQAFFEFGKLVRVRSSRVSIFTKRRTERREG
ncbi:hypothetical protein LX32DRAFT_206860 [Colletotrichum zoysiae]|uniref:Uncharacterized protein n=1 Tax=Colletotrichum zoysiae TaxID=1216348 RepID=A0AAD9M7P9_9PEZI|nr:hypothetical protein LX32DRAFT_206860 [Colletotrichum zoysiae]